MVLGTLQAGAPVLRQRAGARTVEEVLSPAVQPLTGPMRDTLRDVGGVGLTALVPRARAVRVALGLPERREG